MPNGNSQGSHPAHDRDWLDYLKIAAEIIGLGFLIAYTVYAGLQWSEMKRATDSSREIFTVGRRPWLGIDGVPTMAQNDRGGWIIESRTKNFGFSVGLHYVFATNPIIGGYSGDLTEPIDAACRMGENLTLGGNGLNEAHPVDHGYTVFPGNSMKNQAQSVGGDGGVIFIGCLSYLDEFSKIGHDPVVHRTPFCYNIRRPVFIGEEMTPCFSVKPPD
jgi:hypothetical protein